MNGKPLSVAETALRDLRALNEVLHSLVAPCDLLIVLGSSHVLGLLEGFLHAHTPAVSEALRQVHQALKPHRYECQRLRDSEVQPVRVFLKGGGSERGEVGFRELVVSLTPMSKPGWCSTMAQPPRSKAARPL